MPRRRDVLALVLIVLPWTLLISMWHQGPVTPQLITHKSKQLSCIMFNIYNVIMFNKVKCIYKWINVGLHQLLLYKRNKTF